MRKLVFVLAFMLTSSFGFAGSEVSTINSIETKTSVVKTKTDFNLKLNVTVENLDELPTRCRLTYNFVNGDGEIIFTVSYSVTLSSGTCQGAANLMRADAIAAYYEYMG